MPAPKTIESPANSHFRKALKVLAGKDRHRCVIEGKKLLIDAMASGVQIEEVFLTAKLDTRLLPPSAIVLQTSPALMKRISSVDTPPGVVALGVRQELAIPELPAVFGAVLFGIRDPGNLGTIIRAAEAAGCEYLICSKDCVDPYHPRVIRASMGSLFRMAIRKVPDFSFLHEARKQGVTLYGLSTKGKENLFHLEPRFPALVLIGSESEGLPADLPVDEMVSIPMAGKVESLNAAMAATLAFFTLTKSHL